VNGIVWPLGGVVVVYYGWWGFRSMSKNLLGKKLEEWLSVLKAYVGETGRNFATSYKEHKNAFRTASHSSNFARYLIEHQHSFGHIHNTMQILKLHPQKKKSTFKPYRTLLHLCGTRKR
jgi:hypothetical protein